MSYSATTNPWPPAHAGTVNVHFHAIGHHCPDALDQTDDGSFAGSAPAAASPVIVGDALTDVLYLQEPGTSAPISPLDINQGQMGDCFLCSSMGELAMWDPSAISNMIRSNANGTETVTLYLAANGSLPTFGTTSFEATTVTVDNNFPSNSIDSGATQDVYDGEKEIWPQVLENAVATLGGGYNSIANGGNPVIALEELTGIAANPVSPSALTLSQLQADTAANDLIVMDTGENNVGYGLYNDHAYMFEDVTTVNGAPAVQLLNPWGFDDPSPIPFSDLADEFVEVDVGQGPSNNNSPSPPTLVNQTAGQTWLQGTRVSFTIAAGTFVDPQHESLTYAAAQANGQGLPSWLSFNATTRAFSGTVPAGMETLSLSVTATDTSGLSTSDTFQVTVPAAAPKLTHQTTAQTWTEGTQISFVPAANTFTDPQSETLSYSAALSNGQPLPSWLSCDPSTGTFSGTVAYTSGALDIKLTATDTSGLAASETFVATLVAPAPTVTDQTPNQAWVAGSAVSLALASDTFSAVPGQTLSYAATLPTGLTFTAATETIGGSAPFIPGTYTIRVTATQTNRLSVSETFQAVVTASAPTVTDQTAGQAWTAGQTVSLPLASDTFTDPQGEKLTYAASGVPTGLVFNPTTATFSGVATVIPGTYTIKVTATDASRLSTYETFQAVVTANAPTVTDQTANQAWTAWQTVSLPLAAATFTDPQGEKLTLTASGLPSGVTFNPATGTFSGHAPVAAGTYTIKVTATDTSRLSVYETFQAVVTASAPAVTDQTADQAWTAGQKLSLALASDTFTDPQGETLTYKAVQSNGKPLPTGMVFNPATKTFTGTVPVATGTYTIEVTATDTSSLSASETFNVAVSASPPVVNQTPDQAWTAAQIVSLATSFTDPQNERLIYAAAQADGSALPKGLLFNTSTGTFTGSAPLAPQTYGLTVTATDASGLAVSETFNAVVSASPPVFIQTPDQTWTVGQKVSLATSFTDPQGEKLTYTATQSDGSTLPKGLVFNTVTGAFAGTPTVPGSYALDVTASDGSGLSTSETFNATVQPVAPVAHASPNLAWTDGRNMSFMVPPGVFTDPQESPLTYAAYEVGGADQTSWLQFNPSPADFFGTVPAGLSGTIGIELVATNSYGLSATETFGLTFAAAGAHVVAAPFTSGASEMLPLPN